MIRALLRLRLYIIQTTLLGSYMRKTKMLEVQEWSILASRVVNNQYITVLEPSQHETPHLSFLEFNKTCFQLLLIIKYIFMTPLRRKQYVRTLCHSYLMNCKAFKSILARKLIYIF